MNNTMKQIRNERGMAMAVVLAMLLMMGLIGVASIKTSVLDMDISRAMTNKVRSFYLADGGLELAITRMNAKSAVVNVDSVHKIVNADNKLGIGYFEIQVTNTYPVRTVISTGHDEEGASAVAMNVNHRRNPFHPWNNAIFAGVGQNGKGIAGNVDIHGSVHILGEGEPFTDQNGDGTWNDKDEFIDLNLDGLWQPGEPLTLDSDGDGVWDPAEPFVDENGSGIYDQTLTATDLSFEASGTAAILNNYSGMDPLIASRIPPLPKKIYNGESVETLDAVLRVRHGKVNLSGTAVVGESDVSGGIPAVKETMDGTYVNDGFGGTSGTANVHSDNGFSEKYDLEVGKLPFPSLNDTSGGYIDHRTYLASNALVISGDLTLQPGVTYTSPLSPNGSISVDVNGRLQISGIVVVTGNVYINAGAGTKVKTPLEYTGRGVLAAGGDMHINTNVLARSDFPAQNMMGFVAYKNLHLADGGGASQLSLMGAFFAQQQITNDKQNQIAGTLMSNHFSMKDVPSLFQVPTLAENLPKGMPGGTRYSAWEWQILKWTWHEL